MRSAKAKALAMSLTTVMRRVICEVPPDYHGTRILKLECCHVTVRKRSAKVPTMARCDWCSLAQETPMTSYRVRIIKPRATEWTDVAADTPEDAAQEIHDRKGRSHSVVYAPDADLPASEVWFALVEVEGHGELVSRIYRSGIARRGGVRPTTLDGIAKELGWTKSPAELVAPGWGGEQEEWT